MRLSAAGARKVWQVVAVLVVAAALLLVLKIKKESLVRDCLGFLQSQWRQSTDFEFKLGKVRGHLSGYLEFEDVEVRRPWIENDKAVVFRAKSVRVRYRLLDFLSKKFGSKIEITMKSPEVRWRSRVGMRKTEFPFLEWLKEWAVAQKDVFVIRLEGLKIIYGPGNEKLEDVQFFYEKDHVTAEIPIRHWSVSSDDVTTTLHVDAHLEELTGPDTRLFSGAIRTEGTVVNWKPIPQESSFDFVFSEEAFEIVSSSLLGGIELTGKIDFTKGSEVDFTLNTNNFPLSNFGPLMNWDPLMPVPGRVDLEARFRGDPLAPAVEARARITKGWAKRVFKTLDVNVSGVYPTVKLSDSRITLEDGTVMAVAPSVVEIKELFKTKTYESLIASAEQETVVVGRWQLSRPKDINDKPEFLAERSLGEKARVQFRKYNETQEEAFGVSDSAASQMEVGFEYGLKSEESLKVALREDGEFVGVERKVKF